LSAVRWRVIKDGGRHTYIHTCGRTGGARSVESSKPQTVNIVVVIIVELNAPAGRRRDPTFAPRTSASSSGSGFGVIELLFTVWVRLSVWRYGLFIKNRVRVEVWG